MTRTSTREFFDRLSVSYEDCRLSGWYKAQAESVLANLNMSGRGALLDVGCGTGWLLRQAAAANPDLSGIGVDVSAGMIAAARKAAASEEVATVDFLVGDWETLELSEIESVIGSRPVSLATCVSCLHYFSNPLAALSRIRQVLRPGGRLILVDRAAEASMLTKIWGIVHRRVLQDEVRFYSTQELVDLLQASGFSQVKVLCKIRKLFWKGKWYTSLAMLEASK